MSSLPHLIERSLIKGDQDDFENYRFLLKNVVKSNYFQNIKYLGIFLTFIMKKQKYEILNITTEYFITVFSLENVVDLFLILCSIAMFDNSILKFFSDYYTDITMISAFQRFLVMSGKKVHITLIYSRLNSIFTEKLSLGSIEDLIELTDNDGEKNFLRGLISEQSEYQDRPEWVNTLKHEEVLKGKKNSELLELDFFKKGETYGNEEIDALTESIKLKMDLKEKERNEDFNLKNVVSLALSSSFEEADEGVLDPDRIFGPKNAILGKECSEGIKGGCRMLTCMCKEDEEEDFWFEGVCDTCLKRIRNCSHALRYPTEHGGWLGCYCSLECLVKNPPIDVDEYADLRIDNMVDVIEKKQIYDRVG